MPSFRLALFTGNYNYTRDGSNQSLNRLVRHLQEVAGAKVRVYSPTTPTPAFEPVGDLISIPSVSVPGRPEYRLGLGLNPAVRRDLLAFAPDIVHLATPDLLGFQAQKLARDLGLPVVASVHTRFESYLGYYGLSVLAPLVERTLRGFYQGCDQVMAPTLQMAEAMARRGLRTSVGVWGRGVDRELFDPARRDPAWRRAQGLIDDELAVLFVGRIVLEKGLGVFAETLARLRSSHPRVRALVVGDGPARAGFEPQLPGARFTGFLTGQELARAVASADIFFNPSTTEAFGNVNLEAMASGLPVICADLANSRALIAHEGTGLLCPADSAADYAAAIARLADQPEFRRSLGCEGRAASAAFSWSACLEGMAEVYRRLLDRKAPAVFDRAA